MRQFREFQNGYPTSFEKLICGFSYLSMGFVGFIWLIISYVTGHGSPKNFVRFHIFQSIFISVIVYLFKIVAGILLAFITIIPFIGNLVQAVVFYTAQYPLIFSFSILQFALIALIVYLAVFSFLGKDAEVPWVSENIRKIA